ncbi:hypothetical protein OROMI_031983 [Orobanche minor]
MIRSSGEASCAADIDDASQGPEKRLKGSSVFSWIDDPGFGGI